jgi:hypothetical protein
MLAIGRQLHGPWVDLSVHTALPNCSTQSIWESVTTENPRLGTEERTLGSIAELLGCSLGEVALEPSTGGTLGIISPGVRFRAAWAASGDVAEVGP